MRLVCISVLGGSTVVVEEVVEFLQEIFFEVRLG